MLDLDLPQGAPLAVGIIVLLAIIVLGGISFGFQGSIQF